jgi:predicted amidophosphoribosyltransferase
LSAQFDTPGTDAFPAPDACPVCGAHVTSNDTRCRSCGYHLAGIGGRPGPFDRTTLIWTVVGFAVVYVLVALVVLAAR